MTNKEIEHMWKVASNDPHHDFNWFDPVVVKFAKLVAEHEREECAKICEDIALGFTKWPESYRGLTAETKLMRSMGEFVHKPFVDAIRARGQK
jgi:hypothetical protein